MPSAASSCASGRISLRLCAREADVGIATEALASYDGLVALPCYRWTHSVVVPKGHALLDGAPLTLERLARFPIITYGAGYTGRLHIGMSTKAASD